MNASESHYFQEADTWHSEIVLKQRSQLKIAYLIGAAALILAALCVIALVIITPLKTVTPYVIEVDKITGEAKVLNQYKGDVQNLTFEEVLSKFWINQYLIARESYSPNIDLEENYNKVRFLSEGKGFDMYAKRFGEDHPDNPFKKYGDSRVEIEVKSISFLRKDTATIRYELIQTHADRETRSHWIDIVNYRYVNSPMTEAERLANPLGFKVTEYRSDREVVN
jgi:type IV secretion system protein VirB8